MSTHPPAGPTEGKPFNPAAVGAMAGVSISSGTATGLTVDGVTPAQMDILANGAKATCTATLIAFNTWADGQTIVFPTIGSHTIKKTSAGDIDVSGAANIAAATAIIDAYLSAQAGATCNAVSTGTSMVVTAKAYGATLNASTVTGTLFAVTGTMAGGKEPIDNKADLVPGVVTIPGDAVAPATAVSPGAQSAADKAKQDTQAYGGWYDGVVKLMDQYAPGASEPGYQRAAASPFFVPATLPAMIKDGAKNGGCLQIYNGAASGWAHFTPIILEAGAVSSRPWAVALDMILPITATGMDCKIGLGNENHRLMIAQTYATNTTHWYITSYNGAFDTPAPIGAVCDGLRHTFILAWDLTTFRVLVDGVIALETTGLTHKPTQSQAVLAYATTGAEISLYQFAWAT